MTWSVALQALELVIHQSIHASRYSSDIQAAFVKRKTCETSDIDEDGDEEQLETPLHEEIGVDNLELVEDVPVDDEDVDDNDKG